MNVRENFETITKEIAETCEKVGRNADEVKLIAVSMLQILELKKR